MDATISHQLKNDRFVLERDGKPLGYLTYRATPSQVTIDYVQVDPSLRGTGMGNKLVDAAVAWARTTNRPIDATCSFARRVLRTTGT